MTIAEKSNRVPGSRLLHQIDQLASRPSVAVAVVAGDAVWLVYSSAIGFPNRLETIFQTLVAALTLAMVFVIQHTQSRQQIATQRKLDEILSALPHASNTLIALEDGSDQALGSAREAHRELRHEAIQDATAQAEQGVTPSGTTPTVGAS